MATNCQNCGEDGECNEPCKNCEVTVDPCGEPTCVTCVEQFTVFDRDGDDDDSEVEHDECPLRQECRCAGTCELAAIEQKKNEYE